MKKIYLTFILSLLTLNADCIKEIKTLTFEEYLTDFNKVLENKDNKFKLNRINLEGNLFKYKADNEIYNKSDYWANPKEFFLNRGGDCEDYVIFKYYLLKKYNIGEDYKFVYETINGVNHLYLLVKLNGEYYRLDNNYREPKKVLDIKNINKKDPFILLKKKVNYKENFFS